MGYVPEATIPAVLLLAHNGLKVNLRPGKTQGNLWMLPPSTARKFHPPLFPQDPLRGTPTTCLQCGPLALAGPWPILQLLARQHHTPMAPTTPEQHQWLHTHFEPAPADGLATVTWESDTTAEWLIQLGMFHTKHPDLTSPVLARHRSTTPEAPAYPVKHRCLRGVPETQTIEWTTYHPKWAFTDSSIYTTTSCRDTKRNHESVQRNAAATEIIRQRIRVHATPEIEPATTIQWATIAEETHVHAYQPTSPCRLPQRDDQNTVIFAGASGTMSLTPAASGAALELGPDATGQLRQHHLTGTTIFGASSNGELKTLAIIVDAVGTISEAPHGQPPHVWVVVDAAADFQIIRRLARQPLNKATDSSLGTKALHLWMVLRNLPGHMVLHLVKQESHRYNLGNGHIDPHAHNQLAEHVPSPQEPPLHDHMHTHLQHLRPVPHPGERPPWVPDDVIYNDTGRAYHYPQPLRTMAHIRGTHADNTLMACLQQELQTMLYFSALNPLLLSVHLQNRVAQLLLQQLPLLDRVARCYSRKGIDIPPEYTVCPCHLQQPETWDHYADCPRTASTWPRETGGHDQTTRRMGPGDSAGQWGRAPDAATRDQGSRIMRGCT